MCEWHGGNYDGNLPVKLFHPRLSDGIDTVHVDPCIQTLVQAINDAGFQTLNCCCGHGQRPGWIALEDGRHILIAKDHEEMRRMDEGFPALVDANIYENEVICPFCHEGDFDLIGLRSHLTKWCDAYAHTPTIN